jgi:hypothetical protein
MSEKTYKPNEVFSSDVYVQTNHKVLTANSAPELETKLNETATDGHEVVPGSLTITAEKKFIVILSKRIFRKAWYVAETNKEIPESAIESEQENNRAQSAA